MLLKHGGGIVMKIKNIILLISLGLLFITACSGDDSSSYDSMNNTNNTNGGNVNIGGVQDIGVFRDIINSGGIPGPNTLTANGFFSEHYLEYPFLDCGENICLNGMVGRGKSIRSDDFMNVLQVVIKSYVDPEDYVRPPTDFIAVIDVSGSMVGDSKMEYVRNGLRLMVESLKPDDRIALVKYSYSAQELQPLTFVNSDTKNMLNDKISSLQPDGSTNIYDAFLEGFLIAEQSKNDGRFARIVFLSDGIPTAGNTDPAAIISLVAENSSSKVQVTSIGLGVDVNFDLMKNLAMEGGNFYFVENSSAVSEIFVEEVEFFAFPIANDITISLNTNSDFMLGDSVGFDGWENSSSTSGSVYIPALYAASRSSSSTEDPTSRRGGGSALFLRLVPMVNSSTFDGVLLEMSYKDSETGENVEPQVVNVSNIIQGDILNIDSYYSEDVMKKSFLMLNAYLALDQVLFDAVRYEYVLARELLRKIIDHTILIYSEMNTEDDDIENDIALMEQLLVNLGGDISECEYNNCYEDPYYEDTYDNKYDEVHYGCSSTNSSDSTFPGLILLMVIGGLIIRSKKSSIRIS
jgi:Ca-activated chloride channel homolog